MASEGVWDSMGDGLDDLGAWGSDVASDALSSAGDVLSGPFG